jgi:hypothetical protein
MVCFGSAAAIRCGTSDRVGFSETLYNPFEYLKRLTSIFKDVKRVLRSDGVLWIVIGDAYATTPAAGQPRKNLCMVPAQLVMALQAGGWTLRSEII